MSVITKISHQKSLDVCYICVDYLVNKCLREKGLFRNPPSVVEIRKLRTLMLDGACTSLEFHYSIFNFLHISERQANSLKESTLDPHLVAGVLQLTLKDMAMSVFHKIYDDMMGSGKRSPFILPRIAYTIIRYTVRCLQCSEREPGFHAE